MEISESETANVKRNSLSKSRILSMQGRTTFPLTSNEFLTKKLRISLENNSKNKADLFSVKDELDNTAIYYATAGGHLETVTILLKSGVNVNIKNEDGNTCLHKAMINDDIKMIALLISNGADVEALNDKEQTPIYFASKRVRKEF